MRERLPNRRASETAIMRAANTDIAVTWSRFGDGRLGEVFLSPRKAATDIATACRETGVLLSVLLQHGVAAADILHSLSEDAEGKFDGLAAAALRLIDQIDGSNEL